MTRNAWWDRAAVALGALVALALGAGTARAQVVPFKVSGGGPAPDGLSTTGLASPHTATGKATHLGKYTGAGEASVTGPGTFQGYFKFVAANGDVLYTTYGDTDNPLNVGGEPGTFTVVPAAEPGKVHVVFVAEFNPVPGLSTGRFQKVVGGSLVMVARTEAIDPPGPGDEFTAPFDYTWAGEGWLEFQRGK